MDPAGEIEGHVVRSKDRLPGKGTKRIDYHPNQIIILIIHGHMYVCISYVCIFI